MSARIRLSGEARRQREERERQRRYEQALRSLNGKTIASIVDEGFDEVTLYHHLTITTTDGATLVLRSGDGEDYCSFFELAGER